MVKLLNVLVVLSAAQAFSLGPRERSAVQRMSGNKVAAFSGKLQHSAPSYLKMSAESSEGAEIVAKATPAPAKSSSFIDKIWNDNTKLAAYLAVWYLGNVYYNIYNKKACIALGKNAAGASNAHWALSAVQVKYFVERNNIF